MGMKQKNNKKSHLVDGRDVPEAQEKHVVEFVFAECPGHGN